MRAWTGLHLFGRALDERVHDGCVHGLHVLQQQPPSYLRKRRRAITSLDGVSATFTIPARYRPEARRVHRTLWFRVAWGEAAHPTAAQGMARREGSGLGGLRRRTSSSSLSSASVRARHTPDLPFRCDPRPGARRSPPPSEQPSPVAERALPARTPPPQTTTTDTPACVARPSPRRTVGRVNADGPCRAPRSRAVGSGRCIAPRDSVACMCRDRRLDSLRVPGVKLYVHGPARKVTAGRPLPESMLIDHGF